MKIKYEIDLTEIISSLTWDDNETDAEQVAAYAKDQVINHIKQAATDYLLRKYFNGPHSGHYFLTLDTDLIIKETIKEAVKDIMERENITSHVKDVVRKEVNEN